MHITRATDIYEVHELDENNEATGVVAFFCQACRPGDAEISVSAPDGTVCETCGLPEQSVGFVRDNIFYDYFPDDHEHIANLRDRYDSLVKEYGRTLMALTRAREEIERLNNGDMSNPASTTASTGSTIDT